jgi:hypothetical protein
MRKINDEMINTLKEVLKKSRDAEQYQRDEDI